MTMVSVSMPVTSEIEITLRVPSDKRATCTTRMNRRGDLVAHGTLRNVEVRHRDHILDSGESVADGVGVDRGQRALVAGIHGLQHVEGLFAAHLADDDAVGTHTQTVDHQLALADRAFAFDVGGAGFQAHHVLLLQLQFGGILDGDDALRRWECSRKAH